MTKSPPYREEEAKDRPGTMIRTDTSELTKNVLLNKLLVL
jgi:hypothetical protein